MARRLSFIAVEGQHDAAFIGSLLKDSGFRLVQNKDENPASPGGLFLEPRLARLVPEDFPQNNDLLARVAVPFFWQSADHAVALRPANSDSKLIGSTASAIRSTRPATFHAVGIILDADNKGNPTHRMTQLQAALLAEEQRNGQSVGVVLPANAGAITNSTPKCGVFIMPDNQKAGTLEDLLLACADHNYPDLKAQASAYLAGIDRSQLTEDDLDEIGAPAGEQKAQVGAIASILKPGKAIQNSISDCRWLDGAAKGLPYVAALRKFLRDLLDEPAI